MYSSVFCESRGGGGMLGLSGGAWQRATFALGPDGWFGVGRWRSGPLMLLILGFGGGAFLAVSKQGLECGPWSGSPQAIRRIGHQPGACSWFGVYAARRNSLTASVEGGPMLGWGSLSGSFLNTWVKELPFDPSVFPFDCSTPAGGAGCSRSTDQATNGVGGGHGARGQG